MDDWRVNDWRSPPVHPDVNEERRGAAADGDEDRAIRRFLAATEHASPGELHLLRPLVASPFWLLAVAGFLFALGLIWMQLNMMGTNLPPI